MQTSVIEEPKVQVEDKCIETEKPVTPKEPTPPRTPSPPPKPKENEDWAKSEFYLHTLNQYL